MVRRRILSRPALSLAAILAVAAITGIAAVAAVPTNLSKAIEAQRRQTTERPQDSGAYNDLGNLLVLAHQPGDAEAAYRKALELDANKVTALFNLGLLLQQRGDVKAAMSLYEKAVELSPSTPGRTTRSAPCTRLAATTRRRSASMRRRSPSIRSSRSRRSIRTSSRASW